MATYAIGDIQGCFEPFLELLDHAGFREGSDRLWLVGDLVNRGPHSLEMLRWVRERSGSVSWVLGNHELHLLGTALGLRKPKPQDTLDGILKAQDRGELIEMVRHAPVVHREGACFMVHAGLHPAWSLDGAEGVAREVEAALRGSGWEKTMGQVYDAEVSGWKASRTGARRLKAALNYFTRARFLSRTGAVTEDSGPPCRGPSKARPWYEMRPPEDDERTTIVFGHWSTLGLLVIPGFRALDTGCVYGRALTALRLDDGAIFQVPGLAPPVGIG